MILFEKEIRCFNKPIDDKNSLARVVKFEVNSDFILKIKVIDYIIKLGDSNTESTFEVDSYEKYCISMSNIAYTVISHYSNRKSRCDENSEKEIVELINKNYSVSLEIGLISAQTIFIDLGDSTYIAKDFEENIENIVNELSHYFGPLGKFRI